MTASAAEAGLRIEFLNIGKADCMLLLYGGKDVVVPPDWIEKAMRVRA